MTPGRAAPRRHRPRYACLIRSSASSVALGPDERDGAVLQHVGAVRAPQRPQDVLLDQQDGQPVAVDRGEVGEDRAHRHRSQAQRGLVEHQQPGPGHQRTPDRDHLLLASRERAGQLGPPLGQPREQAVDTAQRLGPARAARRRPRAQLQVLQHGHGGKELAPFGNVGDAGRHHGRRAQAADPPAVQRHGAPAQRQQAGHGPQRGGLARAVAPDERDDLAGAHLERDAPHGHDVPVARLDAVKPEQRSSPRRPGRPRSPADPGPPPPAVPRRCARRSSGRRCAGPATSPPA